MRLSNSFTQKSTDKSSYFYGHWDTFVAGMQAALQVEGGNDIFRIWISFLLQAIQSSVVKLQQYYSTVPKPYRQIVLTSPATLRPSRAIIFFDQVTDQQTEDGSYEWDVWKVVTLRL